MLPKINRLDKKTFDFIFKNGRNYHSDSLYLKKYLLPESKENHFAAVVSKKVSKKAVERNKIRRQIFGILREKFSNIEKPFGFIFFIKKQNSFSEYEKELNFLIKKSSK